MEKPPCQYSGKCYRKNPAHFEEYSHAQTFSHVKNNGKSDNSGTNSNKKTNKNKSFAKNKRNIDSRDKSESSMYIQTRRAKSCTKNDTRSSSGIAQVKRKKRTSKQELKEEKKMKINDTREKELEKDEASHSEDSDTSVNDVKSTSWTYIKTNDEEIPRNRSTLGVTKDDIIKLYYLVEMPTDFYSFFNFCKTVNETEPLAALKPYGLSLVGPYDLLAGREVGLVEKEQMLNHWRYFYDTPELQTVLAAESGFHIGYWRDVPKELPVFLASNNNNNCLVKIEGENIFGAVHSYLADFIKNSNPFDKTKAAKLQSKLSQWAVENNYTLDKTTSNISRRQKRVNSKTFHGGGIVVPVDKKTEVGYRPLIEKDANIKKICQLIMSSSDKEEQETLLEKLQPLITFANIANDECDFGNSLELGIDLFCMGSPIFHDMVEHLLTTAYSLLNRLEFGEIIRIHLKNRRNGTNLSIL